MTYFDFHYLIEEIWEAVPQVAPSPKSGNTLICYECNPTGFSITPNSHTNMLDCLTNEYNYGEFKVCDDSHGACAKGTIGKLILSKTCMWRFKTFSVMTEFHI